MTATRHEVETDANLAKWQEKPLLRAVYAGLHKRIAAWIDRTIPGRVLEIGSGIGSFGESHADTLLSDRWIEPWLDVVCDAYRIPFRTRAISHIILADVFHHLSAPRVFLAEARKILAPRGRVILLEPYISFSSALVYGLLHPEPIGWGTRLDATEPSSEYFAAQGNATRMFFRQKTPPAGWTILRREAFASFAYLLSGGFSRPAFYPFRALGCVTRADEALSYVPRLFGARCLIVLERSEDACSSVAGEQSC